MDSRDKRSALEPAYRTAALLLRASDVADGDKLAGVIWRAQRERITSCLEGEQRRLRPSALALAAALVSRSAVVARELLQELERGGTRVERCLREAEDSNSTAQQLAALGLAFLGANDRAVLLRLLGGAHRRLASAPLRLLPRLSESLQLRVLNTVRESILDAVQLPLRAKLAPCTSTLEQVAALYGSRAPVADAAHAHLLVVCTALVPVLVSRSSSVAAASSFAADGVADDDGGGGGDGRSRSSVSAPRSAVHDMVLRLLLALRPTSETRQQRLLLATLARLPSLVPAYLQVRGGTSSATEPRASRQWFVFLAFTCRLARVSLRANRRGSSTLSDAADAAALVDVSLPAALCRPFWSRALLHTSLLVRLYASHALLLLLPLMYAEVVAPRAAAAAKEASSTTDGRAADSLRLLIAEIHRRLPDVQVLISGIGGSGGNSSVGGTSEGGGGSVGAGSVAEVQSGENRTAMHADGGKLETLIEGQLLHALRHYARLVPAAASECAAHAERLIRTRALAASPLALCNALLLHRSATVGHATHNAASAPSGGAAPASSLALASASEAAATHLGEGVVAVGPIFGHRPVDTVVLSPAAELAALIRLACSPQPLPLRTPLWSYVATQLRDCGALHLATYPQAEVGAWLGALRSEEDDAATLAALLHACVGSLHAHVDRATSLTAAAHPQEPHPQAQQLRAEWRVECHPDAGAPVLQHAPRLSPLAVCAVSRLCRLASDAQEAAPTAHGDVTLAPVAYLCRSLLAVGQAHPHWAALLKDALVQEGVAWEPGASPQVGLEALSSPQGLATALAASSIAERMVGPGADDTPISRHLPPSSPEHHHERQQRQQQPASVAGKRKRDAGAAGGVSGMAPSTDQCGFSELLEWHHALMAASPQATGIMTGVGYGGGAGNGGGADGGKQSGYLEGGSVGGVYDGSSLAGALVLSPALREQCRRHLTQPSSTLWLAEASAVRLVRGWLRAELTARSLLGEAHLDGTMGDSMGEDDSVAELALASLPRLVNLCCAAATHRATNGAAAVAAGRELHTARMAGSLFPALLQECGARGDRGSRRALTDRLREAAAAAAAACSPHGYAVAAALCSMVCEEAAAGNAISISEVQRVSELAVRLLRLAEGGASAEAEEQRPLCTQLLRLLQLPMGDRALSDPPESLLYEVRDLMRKACEATTLRTARSLLRLGAARPMKVLLPQLQRQIICESPLLARLCRTPFATGLESWIGALAEQLHLLVALADACPLALSGDALVRLLKSATCAPHDVRRLLWRVVGCHVQAGMPLAKLETAEAADVASHAAHISHARSLAASHPGPAEGGRAAADGIVGHEAAGMVAAEEPVQLMAHELHGLQWLRPEEFHALAEAFPPDVLSPPPSSSGSGGSHDAWGAGGGSDDPWAAPAGGGGFGGSSSNSGAGGGSGTTGGAGGGGSSPQMAAEPLGTLLVLEQLLSIGRFDARQWAERGGTGLCVMALAAESAALRAVAYECLGRYMGVLMEGPSFAERRQVNRILCSLRDAVVVPNARLPCVTTAFVAHGLRVLLRPTHPQYRALNAYIVSRPYMPLDEVPMFFNAFHGGGPRAREERIWLLQLMSRALLSEADLAMCRHRHALQLILSLHDSPLADSPTRRACLGVLCAAARLPEGATALLHDHSIAGWIVSALSGTSRAAAAASGGAAPAFAALLWRAVTRAHGVSLDGPQLLLCTRALERIWHVSSLALAGEPTASDGRGVGGSRSGVRQQAEAARAVEGCARLLLVIGLLPLAGGHVWPHVSCAFVHGLLISRTRTLHAHTAPATSTIGGRALYVDQGALALLYACGGWLLERPHERGEVELEHAASLVLLGARVLVEDAASCAGHLAKSMRAFVGLVSFIGRCCSSSSPFRSKLCASSVDGGCVVARLFSAIGLWSGAAELDELAGRHIADPGGGETAGPQLERPPAPMELLRAMRTLNRCTALLVVHARRHAGANADADANDVRITKKAKGLAAMSNAALERVLLASEMDDGLSAELHLSELLLIAMEGEGRGTGSKDAH